jgi:hypothetical protein
VGISFDQKVQLWNTIGTWFAGVAGFGAIATALWLAARNTRVRLRTNASIWTTVENGKLGEDVVTITATNLGDRSVIIEQVGWQVGLWRGKRYAVQIFSPHISDRLPLEIAHGKSANFRVSLADAPTWANDLREKFIRNQPLWTLKAFVATSVGTTVLVPVGNNIIKRLKH